MQLSSDYAAASRQMAPHKNKNRCIFCISNWHLDRGGATGMGRLVQDLAGLLLQILCINILCVVELFCLIISQNKIDLN